MNFRTLVQAALRHKFLLVLGVIVGLALAVSVLYRIDYQGRQLHFSERSVGVYETQEEMIISDSEFAIGRTSPRQGGTDSFQRTINLAPSYARIMTSDSVLRKVALRMGSLTDLTIVAEPVEQSPILRLSVTGSDPERVKEAAALVAEEFAAYLKKTQDDHEIPGNERISVAVLSKPTVAVSKQSRRTELAALSFVLTFLGFVGVAYVMESMDASRQYAVSDKRSSADETWST